MDSISSLLSNKDFIEPAELTKLKNYISSNYKVTPVIAIHSKGLIISIESAALASSLRLNLPAIKEKLGITQKVIIRIH